jgi:hypothetical protein
VVSDADDSVTLQAGRLRLRLELGQVVAWGSVAHLAARPSQKDLVVLDNGPLLGDVHGLQAGMLLVKTSLKEEPLRLKLDLVRAVRLAQPVRPPRGLHLAGGAVPGRSPLLLAPAWPPALAVDPAVTIDPAERPPRPVLAARFAVRGGRRVFLSDLTPAAVEEEGAFGKVWPHARDADIDGSPCFLGGVHRDKCVVVHSRARLTWRLAKGYERFSAAVGISDALGKEGDCDVQLLGDGEVLWERKAIRGGAAPLAVELADLGEVDELTVVVDYGGRYDIGDHLVLADAWLVRKKQQP